METDCSNGVDEDQDALIDCEDGDCAQAGVCARSGTVYGIPF
jgi:hypothetical protein